MNYKKIYDSLIERGLNRPPPSCYTEKHHIIPKCLGGPDIESNILTAEEHYLAHQLLTKIYPGDVKLSFAALAMCGVSNTTRNNKVYKWLRVNHSKKLVNPKQAKYILTTAPKL